MARLGKLLLDTKTLGALLELPEGAVIHNVEIADIPGKLVLELIIDHRALPVHQEGGLIPTVEPILGIGSFNVKRFKHWQLKT